MADGGSKTNPTALAVKPVRIPGQSTAGSKEPRLALLDPGEVVVGERSRKDLGERLPAGSQESLPALCASIELLGQLHPIVVRTDMRLVAGGRRLEACRQLGRKVRACITDDFVEIERFLLAEASENACRKPLSKSESVAEAEALRPYFEKEAEKARVDGNRAGGASNSKITSRVEVGDDSSPTSVPDRRKTRERLANAVGMSNQTLTRATAVCKAAEENPDLAPLVAEMDKTNKVQKAFKALQKHMNHKAREEALAGIELPPDEIEVHQGPCVDGIAKLVDASVACVVTDPPYGITTHTTRKGGLDYADGPEYAMRVIRECCEALLPKLMPNAHLYFFAGYTFSNAVKELLGEYFEVQDNPIIWVKDNHTMADFSSAYPNRHEYVWFCKARGAGERRLAACVPDVLTVGRERDSGHSAQKPVELLTRLIEQSTIPGELVVDPFMGSGSTGVACVKSGRRFVGCELEQEWAEVARARLSEAI